MSKLQANIILEILGRPADHVTTALTELLERLGNEKGVNIIEKNIHEPIPKENTKDLFTSFAEISLELDSLNEYLGVLFAYMPSHVEITHPEKLTLANIDFNELGNKLTQRLHEYDAITKKSLMETEILAKKLQEVAPHLFKKPAGQEPAKQNKTKKPKKAKKSKK